MMNITHFSMEGSKNASGECYVHSSTRIVIRGQGTKDSKSDEKSRCHDLMTLGPRCLLDCLEGCGRPLNEESTGYVRLLQDNFFKTF